MNVLKIILAFFLFSSLSYANPEVTASNAVIYKTIGDVALNLHVYNPKNFDEKKVHNAIIFFHGGGWNNGSHKAFKGLSRGKVGADGYTRQDFYKTSYQYNTNTTAMGSFNYRINSNHKLAFTSLFLNSSTQNHDAYNGFDIEFDNEVTDNGDGFGFIQSSVVLRFQLIFQNIVVLYFVSFLSIFIFHYKINFA